MTLSDHSSLIEASVRVGRHEPYANPFDAFVRESSPALARLAFLLTGDRQLGEDLLQTALSKVLPHWHRVIAQGDPTPYVRTVMVRTAIGWRRRRWNGETPANNLPEPTAASDFSNALDTRERLRAALTTLPARQRAVVVLRFYEDRTEAEVARCSAVAPGPSNHSRRKGSRSCARDSTTNSHSHKLKDKHHEDRSNPLARCACRARDDDVGEP